MIDKSKLGSPYEAAQNTWETHWKKVLCDENNNINSEVLKLVLYNYVQLQVDVSTIYKAVSDNKISDPHTPAEFVLKTLITFIHDKVKQEIKRLNDKNRKRK